MAPNLLIRRIGVNWVRETCCSKRAQGAILDGIKPKDVNSRSGGSLSEGRFMKLEPTANDGMVVEGDDGVCEDLVSAAPFAGNQHNVAGAGVGERDFDGDLSVGLDANLAGAHEAC